MPPIKQFKTHQSLATQLSQQPLQGVVDAPVALMDRLLHRTLPRPKSRSNATLLSRLTERVSTLRSRISSPRSFEYSPSSSTPDLDMMPILTTPFESTSRCSIIMRMNSVSSTEKEKIKCVQELGIQRKRVDPDDPELLISMKKRPLEELGKETSPSMKRVCMMEKATEQTTKINQGLQNDHALMSHSSHSSLSERLVEPSSIWICDAPSSSSRITHSTSRLPDAVSPTLPSVPSSQRSNGLLFCQEKQSILTPSSLPTIQPQLTKYRLTKYLRGLLSTSQRTCPTPPRQKESLRTRTSGLLPGTRTARPSLLLSCIGIANSPSTNSMCLHSSG